MENTKYYETFCGQKISEYGLQNGYVDYHALAESINCVRCNDIINLPDFWDVAEMESGEIDNSDAIEEIDERIDELEEKLSEIEDTDSKEFEDIEAELNGLYDEKSDLQREEDEPPDVFQWYIVDDTYWLKQGNEIVYYYESLDIYVWGVTHCGTAWSYVLTDIPCSKKEGAE